MTEEPNFEESLAALEATVDALSRGDLPLDRALAVFEEGLGLYRRCHAILAESEQRVTKLIAAAEGLIEDPFPVEGVRSACHSRSPPSVAPHRSPEISLGISPSSRTRHGFLYPTPPRARLRLSPIDL